MEVRVGKCWLCGTECELTKEHIPPKSAYNEHPRLLRKVDEHALENGWVNWNSGEVYERGIYRRSLCARCNNNYGSIYGEAYVNFVRKVADRIGDVREFHTITIGGVKQPLRILKQVILNFVTSNGAEWVRASNWVAPFLLNPKNMTLPHHVGVYLYATNTYGGRSTGITAHIDLESGTHNTISEFSYWPLGTVISLDGEPFDRSLKPIQHWVQYSFDHEDSITVDLTVNPTATANPVDFRNQSQVQSDSLRSHASYKKPSDEEARAIFDKAITHSGTDGADFRVMGHPSTFRDEPAKG